MHTFLQRAERARELARRYPTSEEVLTFFAALSDWQAAHFPVEQFSVLAPLLGPLVELVHRTGPRTLAEAGTTLERRDFAGLIADQWAAPKHLGPTDFFVRSVLQLYAVGLPAGIDCPWCRQPPQVGCLRTAGDGQALELVCGLCMRRRTEVRDRCPGCGERNERRLVTYSTGDFAHLRLRACDTCKAYVLLVDLEKEIQAIPEVDEIAGLALDLWASEAGYHKMLTNIVGV